MRSTSRATILGIALGLVSIATRPGRSLAQDSDARQLTVRRPTRDEAIAESPRALAGHLFSPSELVTEPFVSTRFESSSGVGLAQSTSTSPPIAALVGIESSDLEQAAFFQRFGLQLKLASWLAVRASAGGIVYSGVTLTSALRLGATAGYTLGGGITAGTRVGERLQISFVGDVTYGPLFRINVADALVESIEAARVRTGALLTDGDGIASTAGLAAAYALHRAVGLAGNLIFEHTFGDTTILERQNAVLAAALVDVDLGAFSPVPVAVIGAYQIAIPFESERDALWHSLNGGVFYTGRPEIALGVEGSVRRFPQQRFVDTDAFVAVVTVRYYW